MFNLLKMLAQDSSDTFKKCKEIFKIISCSILKQSTHVVDLERLGLTWYTGKTESAVMCICMDRRAISPFFLKKPTFSHSPTSRTRIACSISNLKLLLFVVLCFIKVAQQQQQPLDSVCVGRKGTLPRNSIY